jgi:hypothetical protein
MTEKRDTGAGFGDTLETPAEHQGPHGETVKANDYLSGIHCANAMAMDDQPWSFPDYVNGNDFSAGGNRQQCWSASPALMGHYALKGKKVFMINEDDTPVQ